MASLELRPPTTLGWGDQIIPWGQATVHVNTLIAKGREPSRWPHLPMFRWIRR